MSEEGRCQKQVWRGYGMGDGPAEAGHSQCRRSGRVEEQGKWWCSIHAPSAEAARLAKRAEKALPPTFLTEGYDKGFAEGVDWATPRIWNEAIEAAAEYHDIAAAALRKYAQKTKGVHSARRGTRKAQRHEEYAAAIRKLKKP